MGWFWGTSSGSSTAGSGDDAYNKLDPSLRDFLDKESPARYNAASPSASSRPTAQDAHQQNQQQQESIRSQLGITRPDSTASSTTSSSLDPSSKPAVPKESLFQDGRYAHLWKNYQPLEAMESSQRSDQDRLTDVIEAFNERKASIGRAAVENCIFEQLAEHECFAKGGMHAKLTMCRDENKAFNRCYQMQSRFLKALGYLGMERTEEEEERIQMHADRLYQEMLVREAAVKKAKEEGKEEPVFKPLLNNASAAEAMGVSPLPATQQPQSGSVSAAIAAATGAQPTTLPIQNKEGLDIYAADKRKDIEARLAGKSKTERELEIQLIVAESNASVEYAQKIRDYYDDEKRLRADRKERGRETFGDTIKRVWGWDR